MRRGGDKLTIRIVGIETSCDETAVAVVEEGRVILSNIVASQIDLHAQYGGVFPEKASRAHVETITPVITEAMAQAHVSMEDLTAVAVTRGPGLAGSLLVGMSIAKGLALGRGLPLIGINHLEGHIYSLWLDDAVDNFDFPILALIVSGGHTELVLMEDHMQYRRLGGTLDDAAGEAFDKVGRMLGLPYPGGPHLEKAAQKGNSAAFSFPRAWLDGTWDFSFSGLKTAVMRECKSYSTKPDTGIDTIPSGLPTEDLAASFQAAVVEVLVEKTVQAAQEHNAKSIIMAGGVSANQTLRTAVMKRAEDISVYIPSVELCTDNGAMIAAAGYWRYVAGQRDGMELDVLPTWPLGQL